MKLVLFFLTCRIIFSAGFSFFGKVDVSGSIWNKYVYNQLPLVTKTITECAAVCKIEETNCNAFIHASDLKCHRGNVEQSNSFLSSQPGSSPVYINMRKMLFCFNQTACDNVLFAAVLQERMDLLFLEVRNVTSKSWEHMVYGYIDLPSGSSLAYELQCFKSCYTEETNCDFFAVENQRCYYGRNTHTGGTLTGTTDPDSWDIYYNIGKICLHHSEFLISNLLLQHQLELQTQTPV